MTRLFQPERLLCSKFAIDVFSKDRTNLINNWVTDTVKLHESSDN